MSDEKKLIPELRFPEFLNINDWKTKKLGEIGDPLMCKRVFKEQTSANPENGIPFYKIGTFGREADAYISIELYKDFKEKYSFPNKGDILISASGTIGRLVVYDGEPAYFQDSNIVWLGNDEELIINKLLFYCYSNVNWQTSDGGIIKRLYNSDFRNIEINYPKSKTEQQKIAACLSSLDDLIEAHNQKLEALKEHKKGLMQNLFPQNGEKVPKFRFPEFVNDGEWVISSLDKISSSIFDGTHQTPKYTKTGIPFFSVENIVSGSKNKFISREDYLFETRNNKPEYGDVLVTRIGSIGIPKVVDWEYEFSVYVTLAVIKKSDKFDSYFLNSYIQSNKFQAEITRRSLLNAAPQKINMNEFRACEVMLPKRIEEQNRIALCFETIDNLINAEVERVEQLKEHKKGLMQGLFPQLSAL